MISYRNRKYCNFIADTGSHEAMIKWKKLSRHEFLPLPNELLFLLIDIISEYFNRFNILTVPAPSFHTYEHYPIWNVAKDIANECNMKLENLFPENSGKTKMQTFGSCGKKVQNIECPSGQFILILDDIYTTGHTLRVTCEAIIKKGSFPVGLAIG